MIEKNTKELDFNSFLSSRKELIEDYLQAYFNDAPKTSSFELWEGMQYAVLSGGKRLRGILALGACEAIGVTDWKQALPLAAGLECIHSMSLVHDDLPCMDNDELRRGKPTCHVVFGEAAALLIGDALLVEGISLCCSSTIDVNLNAKISATVLNAIGARGMTGGQMLDMQEYANGYGYSLQDLEKLHNLKTGALLKASVSAGGMLGKATEDQLRALEAYASNVGLAFQIADDLLDCDPKATDLGKTPGKDKQLSKLTYPRLLGVEGSRNHAEKLIDEAKETLRVNQINFQPLFDIADFTINRRR